MVRFVLCHRYGGAYLDVDMLLLRDWEELWGWSGAFSYKWAQQNRYNTAVLRLRRGSALGSFLLRTALAHGLDFHPTTVSRSHRDAHLDILLYCLPDALFEPVWKSADYVKSWFSLKMRYFVYGNHDVARMRHDGVKKLYDGARMLLDGARMLLNAARMGDNPV